MKLKNIKIIFLKISKYILPYLSLFIMSFLLYVFHVGAIIRMDIFPIGWYIFICGSINSKIVTGQTHENLNKKQENKASFKKVFTL